MKLKRFTTSPRVFNQRSKSMTFDTNALKRCAEDSHKTFAVLQVKRDDAKGTSGSVKARRLVIGL